MRFGCRKAKNSCFAPKTFVTNVAKNTTLRFEDKILRKLANEDKPQVDTLILVKVIVQNNFDSSPTPPWNIDINKTTVNWAQLSNEYRANEQAMGGKIDGKLEGQIDGKIGEKSVKKSVIFDIFEPSSFNKYRI